MVAFLLLKQILRRLKYDRSLVRLCTCNCDPNMALLWPLPAPTVTSGWRTDSVRWRSRFRGFTESSRWSIPRNLYISIHPRSLSLLLHFSFFLKYLPALKSDLERISLSFTKTLHAALNTPCVCYTAMSEMWVTQCTHWSLITLKCLRMCG